MEKETKSFNDQVWENYKMISHHLQGEIGTYCRFFCTAVLTFLGVIISLYKSKGNLTADVFFYVSVVIWTIGLFLLVIGCKRSIKCDEEALDIQTKNSNSETTGGKEQFAKTKRLDRCFRVGEVFSLIALTFYLISLFFNLFRLAIIPLT